jgi:thymidylate synthase (FAD)
MSVLSCIVQSIDGVYFKYIKRKEYPVLGLFLYIKYIVYKQRIFVMKIDVLDKGYVRLVNSWGNELDIVNSARVSYDKESQELSEKDTKLINFLVRDKHDSTLRHCGFTFEVYAPLMIARQWYKHAVSSSHVEDQLGWNESSRRYVTENEEFYIPAAHEWRSKPANSKQGSGEPIIHGKGNYFTTALNSYVDQGEQLYKRAMDEGIAPELARLFLPSYGMYVRWRWTTSLNASLHFLSLRMGHGAQSEIMDYAEAINSIVKEKFPVTTKAWEDHRL